MQQQIIQKLLDFCNNGHTPLSLQSLLKKEAVTLKLDDHHLIWFDKFIHRVRDIVGSEPGHKTLYAFKNGGTQTSYSLMKIHKSQSHGSYRDWLKKLEEIGLLCRFDQPDQLKNWGNKKVYALNPKYQTVTRIILSVIQKKYFSMDI